MDSQDPGVADPAPQEITPSGLNWLSLSQQNIPSLQQGQRSLTDSTSAFLRFFDKEEGGVC